MVVVTSLKDQPTLYICLASSDRVAMTLRTIAYHSINNDLSPASLHFTTASGEVPPISAPSTQKAISLKPRSHRQTCQSPTHSAIPSVAAPSPSHITKIQQDPELHHDVPLWLCGPFQTQSGDHARLLRGIKPQVPRPEIKEAKRGIRWRAAWHDT